jgi:hypothetical protein
MGYLHLRVCVTSARGPAPPEFEFSGWLYGRCCDMIQFSTIEIFPKRGHLRRVYLRSLVLSDLAN